MNDCRKHLVKALRTEIKKVVSCEVYTKIPRGATVVFPYVHISDIYQNESGTKSQFRYSYEVLIKVVYNDNDTNTTLWDNMNSILTLFPIGGAPFALEDSYKIEQAELVSASEEEILEDYGFSTVGLIRIKFDIV